MGRLKGLDCNNSGDFIKILQIIDRDLSLGISEGNPIPLPQPFKEQEKPVPVPVECTGRPYTFKERKFTASELEYWQQYGITPEILEQYKVCSVVQFQSEIQRVIRFPILPLRKNPFMGIKANALSNCTDRFQEHVSCMAVTSARIIVSDWNNYPAKATPCL